MSTLHGGLIQKAMLFGKLSLFRFYRAKRKGKGKKKGQTQLFYKFIASEITYLYHK